MSFVTTPRRSSAPSARQSAATRVLLPEPTGPPMPIRRARSAGKEPLPRRGGWGRRARARPPARRRQRPVVGGDARAASAIDGAGAASQRDGHGGIDRQQLQRGGGDRRGVLVEREQRGGPSRQAAAAATTPSATGRGVSRDASRRPRCGGSSARHAACGERRRAALAPRAVAHGVGSARRSDRRRAQQLRAEPARGGAQRGLGQRAAPRRRRASRARRPRHAARRGAPRRRARVGLGDAALAGGDERRHVAPSPRRPPPRARPSARSPRPGSARRSAAARAGPSEEGVALGHGQLGRRARARSRRRRPRPGTCPARRGSPGSASFSGMSALRTPRVSPTATTVGREAEPLEPTSSAAARRTRASAAPPRGREPANIGRISTGCGVGIDALGSPIGAQAIAPPLITSCGRTPKNAGSHSTRSASLPTSTEPTSPSIPCATAGQIVYLAT